MIFIYLFQTAKFMSLYIKGLLPNTFNNMFTLTTQIHSYNTRNFICFYIFQTFLDFPFVFEDLSFTIHLIKRFRIVSVGLFSKLLKKLLLEKLGCCLFRFALCLSFVCRCFLYINMLQI